MNRTNTIKLKLSIIQATQSKLSIIQATQSKLKKSELKIKPKLKIKPIKKDIKKNALLIGCNYKSTQYELKGCINDVNNLADKLKQFSFSTKILTDNTLIKPTKDNILKELKNLLITSNPNDLLFFTYSGHGSQTIDKNNDENSQE
jgi:hypothetical protein